MNNEKTSFKNMDAENTKIDEFIRIIRKVCNLTELKLHEPFFCGNEIKYLESCISSNFVSSVGRFVTKFRCDSNG